jgi:hypothetical protein
MAEVHGMRLSVLFPRPDFGELERELHAGRLPLLVLNVEPGFGHDDVGG